jgi:CYTH domain-containing protein
MLSSDGETLALKLGQKYVEPDQPAQQTVMTNFYLNEMEYDLLRALPGRRLRKRRYEYEWHGPKPLRVHRQYAIDQFLDHLAGLLLAEIEGDNDAELAGLPVPEFAVCEVTAVPFFTGGNLVLTTNDQLHAQLSEFLGRESKDCSTLQERE